MQVVVARIGRPHGLAGEVSVELRTDDPDRRLAPGSTLQTEPESAGPLRVAGGRVHGGRLLLRFDGVDDRSAAEALRNVLLLAEVDALERPEDPEEFYDHQLVGLIVRSATGKASSGPEAGTGAAAAGQPAAADPAATEPIGTIEEILHLPGQDVLSVRRPDGQELLVPFVSEIVPIVDLEQGLVVLTPPPGLLNPDAAEVAAPAAVPDEPAPLAREATGSGA